MRLTLLTAVDEFRSFRGKNLLGNPLIRMSFVFCHNGIKLDDADESEYLQVLVNFLIGRAEEELRRLGQWSSLRFRPDT